MHAFSIAPLQRSQRPVCAHALAVDDFDSAALRGGTPDTPATTHEPTGQSTRHDTRDKERRGWYRLPGDDVHPLNRSGIAAERLRSPSVSAPHRESLARPTGPGLLTYLIVPKVPKVPLSRPAPAPGHHPGGWGRSAGAGPQPHHAFYSTVTQVVTREDA